MKHKTKTMAKRWLAIVFCLCMILPSAVTLVSAAEEPAYTGGLCEHHTEHTAECGYAEAVEGRPCVYQTEGCPECLKIPESKAGIEREEVEMGLQDAVIVYDDPNALTSDWLQEQINSAIDNEPTTIVIDRPVTVEKTVTVPAGKDITLTDDGATHTLYSQTDEMFCVEGKLTVSSNSEASRLVFNGGTTAKKDNGNIATIAQGGELILNDAVFRGGKLTKEKSGAVYVSKNAVFTMTGGVIEDFSASDDMTGSVLVVSGGNFKMSGGVIQNNENTGSYYTSGGVLLYTWYSDDADAEMTMSGDAVIQNNVAQNGGGVYLIGNTDFRMTGGTITGNRASTGMGGGVCVAGAGRGSSGSYNTKFTMEGGTISHNSCIDSGGGIYVNSDDVILTGGRIEDNTAKRLGGGIYVSEPPQVVRIYNGIVTGNEASVMGGGLWFCPTGDATLAVTNGIAVYENRAEGAGNDFVALSGSTGRVILADRFLGGGAVEWYSDGAVVGNTAAPGMPPQNVTGSVDPDVPRFDPADPGDRLTGIDGRGNYALKAVVSDNTIRLAESQAKLWITGNKAGRGGGIGSNGAALLGEEGRDYTLQVTKEWSGNTPENEKKEISVFLKIGEYELDSVQLNASNNWTATFTQLPDPESLKGDLQYAVVESPVPPNFTSVYQNAVIEGNKIYISITNDYAPERTSVKVAKVWEDNSDQDGIRPESIIVKLLANGKDTKETLTLSSENNWTGSFTGLAKYQDGQEIVYTVEEVSVDGYDSVITGDASAGFVITNSHTPETIDLSGSKTWDDADNQDGKRPDSITIRLYANGEQVKTVTVTEEDGWKWGFTKLPKYENGEEIRYTITEDAIPGYQSEVDGMNVTNHYTPGQINIPVTKNWQDQDDVDGVRPDSITVKLYADGEDTGKELVLDQKNDWTGSFDDLAEYADGVKIVYTIAEVEVEGYDTAISGSAETSFVIRNSRTPDTPDSTDTPKDDTPQTGDATDLTLWIGLLAISGTGLTAIVVPGKKKRYRRKHMK